MIDAATTIGFHATRLPLASQFAFRLLRVKVKGITRNNRPKWFFLILFSFALWHDIFQDRGGRMGNQLTSRAAPALYAI